MKGLHIHEISAKNFLSSGETAVRVILDRSKITVVTGQNGNGKSLITDAICFALYGKPLRKINKANLVNSRNGRGTLCEINFTIDQTDHYVVRRGIKPDLFEIIKNGTLINQSASVRDYQAQLEKIIGMSYDTFTQTVIISKTKYVPFMQLDAASRRQFVETVLNLSIFGDMYKIQQKAVSALSKEMQQAQLEHSVAIAKLNEARDSLVETTKLLKQMEIERQSEISNLIAELEHKVETKQHQINELQSKIIVDNGEVSQYEKLTTLNIQLAEKLKSEKRHLSELEQSGLNCTQCNQPLTAEQLDVHLASVITKIGKLQDAVKDTSAKAKSLEPKVKALRESTVIAQQAHDLTLQLREHQIELDSHSKRLNASNHDARLDQLRTKITEYEKQADELYRALGALQHEQTINDIVLDALKDSGIKSSIISHSLRLINQTINQNLAKFGFFITFTLDSEFNEVIKYRGVDKFSYYNFSEGEKLRIDMAILFAWRQFCLLKSNLTCNLLFFDEMTDASLDYEGSQLLSQMLFELDDTNVFIITHTPEKLEGLARATLKLNKLNGYTVVQ